MALQEGTAFVLKAAAYESSRHEADWDEFVRGCPMATWMHTRRFLSYHGERFTDRSVILEDSKGNWLGIFPAAVDPGRPDRVSSHPGLSYGGILHQGALQGETMIWAFQALSKYYAALSYQQMRYKAIPYFYHQYPCQDDLYALFRLNANRYRCDLASIIDIQNRPKLSSKRRWESQQAFKQGIDVEEIQDVETIERFWQVLSDNLSRKHAVQPVHSLAEMLWLKERFSESIRFVVAKQTDTVIAGLVLFITPMAMHVQYSASSEVGYRIFALHPVVEHSIALATQLGCRYFDFGISNEQDGQYLNTGLHLFKSKFGSGGAIHEFYDLDLKQIELWSSDK